jgi:hypothetical protein
MRSIAKDQKEFYKTKIRSLVARTTVSLAALCKNGSTSAKID